MKNIILIYFLLNVFLFSAVQTLFKKFQEIHSTNILKTTQSLLSKEINLVNPLNVSQSLIDLSTLGLIDCIELIRVKDQFKFIELKNQNNCNNLHSNSKMLIINEFQSSNGVAWKISFIVLTPVLLTWMLYLSHFMIFFITFAGCGWIYSKESSHKKISNLENKNAESKELLVKQVSHDIRSPLAALNAIINSLENVSEEKRVIIRNSVQRINDIANNLLNKNNFNTELENQSTLSIELISPIIDAIISEKRTQFRDRLLIDISIDLDKSYGLFANINPSELKRVVSNLINNSIESTDLDIPLKINIKVESFDDEKILIIITDNGKGISPTILAKLGERGVSEGKNNSTSGTGLGIFHAKKTIESFDGKLIIESESLNINKRGSKLSIILPISETPSWFVKKLDIDSNKKIISLDDDISIHHIWSERFKLLTDTGGNKIEHLIFSSGDELLKVDTEIITNTKLFLIDLELLDQSRSGLDVIEEMSVIHPTILEKTILVTSRYEEVLIRERCERLGIRLIPKSLAGFVPIKLQVIKSQFDAVLLDDDELVRMTWSMRAKKKNIKLKVYSFVCDLLRDLDQYDNSTPFYIDSNLGTDSSSKEIKGEEILEHLYSKGYTELYLCTGYEPDHFSHLKFIKKVFGKEPQI